MLIAWRGEAVGGDSDRDNGRFNRRCGYQDISVSRTPIGRGGDDGAGEAGGDW